MKKLIYSTTIVSALLLGACGDEEPTNESPLEENATEETTDNTTEETADSTTEESHEEHSSDGLNQIIADDENVKATLVNVTKATDSSGKAIYEALFEVENRLDAQIDVGYTEISGDGQPFVTGQSDMTATLIEPGATGQATLKVHESEGGGFPKNVEMSLSISKKNPDKPDVLQGVKDYSLSMTLPAD